MKRTIRSRILGVYDLFLAMGAIWFGIQMVMLRNGTIFGEPYPDSWASKLPFDSWVMPGILAIVIFGVGNVIAAVFSLKYSNNRSWYISGLMGAIFFLGLIVHRIIVGETYIVTNPFLALSVIQLFLSGYVFMGTRKEL